MIHKTSEIDKKAKISKNVKIGPFCYVGPGVELSENVELVSNVHIEGNTKVGKGTKIFPFASIGTQPQDLKFKGEKNSLTIGENNLIREYDDKLPNNLAADKFDYFHELIAHQESTRCGGPGVNDAIKAGFTIGLPPVLKFA